MSTKFKRFLQLSARHKRRRICTMQGHPRNFKFVAHDSNDSNSISSGTSENEPIEILAPHLGASGHNIQNDEFSSDNEDTSVRSEKVENSEAASAEEEDEEEGRDVESAEAQDNMEEENNISNSSEDENNVPQDLDRLKRRTLANAFLRGNLKHTQGNILLKILRQFSFHLRCLPNDMRTLLQTPTAIATRRVKKIAGGEYFHLGLKCTLKKKLENFPEDMLPRTIEIDFSTDGVQIHNSGIAQIWPIQYRIYNCIDKRPMIDGVFKGIGKPSNAFEFFEEFIQEIIEGKVEF